MEEIISPTYSGRERSLDELEGNMEEIVSPTHSRRQQKVDVEGNHVWRETRRKTGAAWAATTITLSAVVYLFDFGTTLAALKTYYYYDFNCQENPAHDPACDRILTRVNNYASAFGVSLFLITLAHLSNALIFWMTLSPNDHPFRLAYFLPLIHLFRLLKVMWQTFSFNGLKDLQNSQEESSNLYNVLGASLDTIPQLILQFHIAITLANYSASLEGAIPIPRILLISILASVLAGTYNGSMAVLSLVPKCTLVGKACIAVIAGVHTIAVISTKSIIVAALTTAYHSARWLIPYAFVSIIFPWIFFSALLKMHNYSHFSSNYKWLRPAESFALAHVSMFIGPMYVIVKHSRRWSCFYSVLILGTLVQIFIELLGIGGVIAIGRYLPYSGIPCRLAIWKSHNDNKYLTCHSFLGTLCPLLLLLFLTTLLFIVVDKREGFPRSDDQAQMSSSYESSCSGQEQGQERAFLPTSNRKQALFSSKLLILILRALFYQTIYKRSRKYHRLDEEQENIMHKRSSISTSSSQRLNTSSPTSEITTIEMASINLKSHKRSAHEMNDLGKASPPSLETMDPSIVHL